MAKVKVVFPGIKDVVYAPLVTTMFFEDGSFETVKYDETSEPYDEKVAYLWCIAKKALGSSNVIKGMKKGKEKK